MNRRRRASSLEACLSSMAPFFGTSAGAFGLVLVDREDLRGLLRDILLFFVWKYRPIDSFGLKCLFKIEMFMKNFSVFDFYLKTIHKI